MSGKIGFTTTIPVEILYAAGMTPVDLNNIFIASPEATRMVTRAEEEGYPRNTCTWIKGLYSVAQNLDLEGMIAVLQGDCSNTEALMETLQLKGLSVIPFAYPFDRTYTGMASQISQMMERFRVTPEQVAAIKQKLDRIRSKCGEIDRMTWQDNLISGEENHLFLISTSDFNGDLEVFERSVDSLIKESQTRTPYRDEVRLAYIGVPPIFTDFYSVLESMGARVVFNEVQRQFSMPQASKDIVQQYLDYTYPYGAFGRIADIQPHLTERGIDGILHYTQTFCYRQIEDLIFREKLSYPFLTLEGENPGKVDARTKMRLETFVNMLKMNRLQN